jgi:hypothetical protein
MPARQQRHNDPVDEQSLPDQHALDLRVKRFEPLALGLRMLIELSNRIVRHASILAPGPALTTPLALASMIK